MADPPAPVLRWNPAEAPAPAADYLVVCREKALDAVMPLLRHRQARGLSVAVLTAEDAAAHFGDADVIAPEPIRKAIDAWRQAGGAHRLRFVLLAGTADMRNNNAPGLPTWIVQARFRGPTMFSPELAGDAPYATPPGALVPDLAIGRLPARSLDELTTMVRKTIDAETQSRPGLWRTRIELVAGQGGFGPVLDGLLEQVIQIVMTQALPYRNRVMATYANPASPYCYDPERFGDFVLERLNAGPAVFLYVGHGHVSQFDTFRWRGQSFPIVSERAVERLAIAQARTFVVTLSCWTGRFDAAGPAIGERLVAAPRGPAAVIGASRISQPYANALFGFGLTRHLLNEPAPTVGEAMLRAKHALAGAEGGELERMLDTLALPALGLRAPTQQRIDQIVMMNLLGDPALANPVARAEARLEAPQRAAPGDTVEAVASCGFADGRALFELVMPRDRTPPLPPALPGDNPEAGARMIARHGIANAKAVAQIEAIVQNGQASARLFLPANAAPGGYHVRVYMWNDHDDATGSRPITVTAH